MTTAKNIDARGGSSPTAKQSSSARISLRTRIRRSRGLRKFRRNRWAMAAMAVILLYFALALWIAAMEVVAWVGQKSEWYDLRESRILGALLPHHTAERVGPPNLAGFGVRQDSRWRSNQYDFMFTSAEQTLGQIDRLAEPSDDAIRAAVERASMAERRLADVPIDRIREIVRDGRAIFASFDVQNRQINAATRLELGTLRAGDVLSELQRTAARQASEGEDAPDWLDERLAKLREDLAFHLEESGFAMEDYVALSEDDDGPLAAIDSQQLFDAADSVLQGQTDGAPRVLDGVAVAARAARTLHEKRAEPILDEIEPLVIAMFPMPTGFDGMLYKARISLGTDQQGRSILIRSIYSAKVAIQVGVVAALISVCFGTLLGASAAFFGKWVDHMVIWVYSTLASIPYLVLLALLAFVFQTSEWKLPWDPDVPIGNTLIPLYAAFCMTFWIGTCRVIRGETLKLKELEYVQAATAIGFSRFYILLKHVIPNTIHLMFISFSLLLIAAIKSEVVLTFLGLGLKDGASWGIMISQSKSEVVAGFFWQIGTATVLMVILVLAFNIVSDALQDAFDPKHVG